MVDTYGCLLSSVEGCATVITPCFTSHYSVSKSLLTLEEPGKAKGGTAHSGPVSVFDLATEGALDSVTLVEDRIDGFTAAYKASVKAKVKLCYGLRLTVVSDAADKTEGSLRNESKVVLFMLNTAGYSDLIRIHNRATTEGFYYEPRTDWGTLKALWTPNLMLALPFFSSFIARNTLSMASIVPSFPARPVVFKEVGSELPFAPLIEGAISAFCSSGGCDEIISTKTVLYPTRAHFKAYQIARCLGNRSKWDKPNVDHLASDAFCFESYQQLTHLS